MNSLDHEKVNKNENGEFGLHGITFAAWTLRAEFGSETRQAACHPTTKVLQAQAD